MNEWLKSYLLNRKQYVKYNECESDILNVQCGVPQGSILGPTLFLLYINDICNVSEIFKSILFADDTNFFCSGKNVNQLCNRICGELSKLNKWFAVNKLSLNVEKTNFIEFMNHKVKDEFIIKIGDKMIQRVFKTKFLGVIIDDKLNWKEHIKYISAKLSKTTAILFKSKMVLDKYSLRTLYCSLFLPYINYCSEIWGNTYKTNLRSILLLQKRAVRIIENVNRFHNTHSLFLKLKVMKFYDLIEYKTAIIMYKAKNEVLPENIQKLFKIEKHPNYNTRQVGQFLVKRHITSLKCMCISICGVKLWNSLEMSIKNCKNEFLFKKEYKRMIFKN